ncbi:MAG: FHA domain-containing protein [Myxococcota bacterium]
MSSTTSYAVVRDPTAGAVRLAPGDLVGRLRSAALRIDDPNVSEVHAYVSLRDGALQLLALRGSLAVGGKVVREVTLTPGLRVALAHERFLDVVEVANPERLLALEGPFGREVLSGRSLSVVDEGGVRLVGKIVPGALAHLWTDGAGWVCRTAGGPPRQVEPGATLPVGGVVLRVVELEVGADAALATAARGRLNEPLEVEGFFDAVRLRRRGGPWVVLNGAAGRLVYELGVIGQPVHWADPARVLWPGEDDLDLVRKRWDVMLIRLRRRLARASIRSDLVSSDGSGKVWLLLERQDRFVDLG